jgi:hypothetical protein
MSIEHLVYGALILAAVIFMIGGQVDISQFLILLGIFIAVVVKE